jgi:hydrogenase/urease accessory protein HupE
MQLAEVFARIKTLSTTFVTWAIVASTALTIVSEELPSAAGTIAKIVAALGAAIAIVRRVTPVVYEDRGLLPVAHPEPKVK